MALSRSILAIFFLALPVLPQGIHAQEDDYLINNVKKSVVLIGSYNLHGQLIGRGTGFFVDEGVIVTNIHVIDGAAKYYKIFSTSDDDTMDHLCYQELNRSDIRLNLEEDVAYIRAYIDCPHGSVFFASEDPRLDEKVEVYGYPSPDGILENFDLKNNKGKMVALNQYVQINDIEYGPWIKTDAPIDSGNSGGPVVKDGLVVGIAVAATTGMDGYAVNGYFIPVSEIRRGLEYANTSTFGYTAQKMQKNTVYERYEYERYEKENAEPIKHDPFNPVPAAGNEVSHADCRASLGAGGEATGYSPQQGNSCRCKASYHANASKTTCLPGSEEYIAMVNDHNQRKKKHSSSSQESEALKSDFLDITEEHYAFNEIIKLYKDGIIDGYDDGTYKPSNTINRAELTKLLMSGLRKSEIRHEQFCFPDVGDEWFSTHVCAAKRLNWVSGYEDGTFAPSNTINRAEAVKIIMEAVGHSDSHDVNLPHDVPTDAWFSDYVKQAILLDIPIEDVFHPSKSLTRGDAAMWIYHAIN